MLERTRPAKALTAPKAPARPQRSPTARAAPVQAAPLRCACGGGCPRCSGRGGGEGEVADTPAPVPAADPVDITSVTTPFNVNGSLLAHFPACTGQPAITFTAEPAASAPHTWELVAGSATLEDDTTLSASGAVATLALGAAQTGGTLSAKATDAQGGWAQSNPIRLASHPTGITSTSVAGDLASAATNYGAKFDHVFTSNDGQSSSLSQVAVGERFPNLPNPDTGSHEFETPFGTFTLATGTLPDAASGPAGNWFLTDSAGLGTDGDNVSIARSMVDIGRHLVSDSNPTPTHPLPAGFTVDQDFHWWCPWSASGARWTRFMGTTHRRELRISNGNAEFMTSANGEENVQDYTGPTGVTAALATPAQVAPSTAGATANTVQVSATQYPSGPNLHYSLRGEALGCSIHATTGVLTIGTRTGQVTVRVANRRGGPNWDEVPVDIATPAPPEAEAAPEAAPEAPAEAVPEASPPASEAPPQS